MQEVIKKFIFKAIRVPSYKLEKGTPFLWIDT